MGGMGKIFPVTADYDLSLTEMIAAGKYDWVDGDITADHFSIGGGLVEVSVGVELVHLNHVVGSEDVPDDELDRAGFRPASLAELLAFGARYPEEQRKFPIFALGSGWQDCDGCRNVPVLWSRSGERLLGLAWFESRWCGNIRFAAVRK